MLDDCKLSIADIVDQSRIYGPGSRTVIWVQGCTLHCSGCWNADLWDFNTKNEINVEDILKKVQNNNVEGLTILGGEPLDQAKSIIHLIYKVHKLRKTVMLYSGYEIHEILADPLKKRAVEISDICIYGRYHQSQRSLFLKWRGSRNQTILFNNQTYKENYKNLIEQNEVEIQIDTDGTITLLGYPNKQMRSIIQNE